MPLAQFLYNIKLQRLFLVYPMNIAVINDIDMVAPAKPLLTTSSSA